MKRILVFLLLALPIQGFSQTWPPYPERHRRLVQSISFAPDGTLYFTLPHREYLEAKGQRVTSDTPRLCIYSARWENDQWTEPQLISFGGQYKEYEPTVSPDGQYLFFNSNRPLKGTEPLDKNNIWFSRKTGDLWSEPEYIPAINTEELEESYATITRGGQLYFVGAIPKGTDEFDYALFTTQFEGSQTKKATKVEELFTPRGSADPWVAADGSYIIFTKFGKDWMKTCDLYISFKEGNSWSAPLVLTELNDPEGPDYAVAISPDEQWLYYRTKRQFVRIPFQPVLKGAKARK